MPPACVDCRYWAMGVQMCYRYPKSEFKGSADWCGEFSRGICQRMKSNGLPCGAPAVSGQEFCAKCTEHLRKK